MRNARHARWAVGSALSLVCTVGDVADAQGLPEFHAYLLADTIYTEVDSVFTVDFWVDSTAQHFNGYELTMQWNPAVVGSVITAVQGSLMTGNPCGNTIAFQSHTDSTFTYEHVILCASYFADGPGLLSSFDFVASGPGITDLWIASDANHTFADSGAWVSPTHPVFPRQVVLHDAVVVVTGDGTDVGEPELAASAPGLGFFPNPTRAGGVFRLEASSPGPVFLDVVDATGRRVLRRQWGGAPPGTFRWSGRGARGASLAAGVYFARLETSSGTAVRKLVLLR
jgi:hypothetical protein